nr:zinc finger, CCHC-type [Tanacetum cinerariifolium]
MHSSSHSAGPSHKRYRSPAVYIPLPAPVTRSLAPNHADLLPPRKRFRDSYSSETNMEEDTEIDTTETEDGRELDIVDGDDNRFSSIPIPSQRSLINGTDDDIGVSEVPKEVPKEVVVQKPELRMIKRNNHVDLTKEFLSSRLSMKDIGEANVILDLTKEFLSSRLSMKDIEEANVILGIRITHESSGISISQSHSIEKILKKLSYCDCTLVSTPIDTSQKLKPKLS